MTLDDDAVRAAARNDPASFVEYEGTLLIDEVQRVPELYLPIKAAVDRDPRPVALLRYSTRPSSASGSRLGRAATPRGP